MEGASFLRKRMLMMMRGAGGGSAGKFESFQEDRFRHKSVLADAEELIQTDVFETLRPTRHPPWS